MPKILLNGRPYGGSSTVSDADHLMVEDTTGTSISAQTMAEHILGDFGTVEEAATATQDYSVGDYIVLGSYFYKVTAAITSGESLVVGTNIEQTNVGAEMSELNSNFETITITPSQSYSGLACFAYKIGKIGFAYIGGNMIMPASWTTIATISSCYPDYAVRAVSVGDFSPAITRINIDGTIEVIAASSSGSLARTLATKIMWKIK